MQHFAYLQGGDPLKRNESDAMALQAKIAAKQAAQQSSGGGEASGEPVVRKKVPSNKNDTIDDLLSAGLTSGKKKAARA